MIKPYETKDACKAYFGETTGGIIEKISPMKGRFESRHPKAGFFST